MMNKDLFGTEFSDYHKIGNIHAWQYRPHINKWNQVLYQMRYFLLQTELLNDDSLKICGINDVNYAENEHAKYAK